MLDHEFVKPQPIILSIEYINEMLTSSQQASQPTNLCVAKPVQFNRRQSSDVSSLGERSSPDNWRPICQF